MKEGRKKTAGYLANIWCRHLNQLIPIIVMLILIAVMNAVLPQFSVKIVDEGLIKKNTGIVVKYSTITLMIACISAVIYILIERKRLIGYNAIQTDLKEKAVHKIMRIRCAFFHTTSATELFQQLDEDIEAICSCFSTEFILALIQVFISAGTLPVLFFISWKLTVFMLASIPVHILLTVLFSKIGYTIAKDKVNVKKEYSSFISDIVSGSMTIRYFGMNNYFLSVFKRKQKNIADIQYKQEMLGEGIVRLENVFSEVLIFALYVMGGYLIEGNALTIGQFVAFQTYSFNVLGFIEKFLSIVFGYISIKPSVERYIDFMNEKEEPSGTRKLSSQNLTIDIRNVDFGYHESETIIRNLDLHIIPGEHIAVVGKNGCGKTTLINLLLRLYQPQSGRICINGTDISEYEVESYRRSFSVVSQKPYMFCDTIRNNICLYQEVSDEKLDYAVRLAGLSDLIEEKGLSYIVGKDGSQLSGGQRQRIAFARTLVSNSPIVILDEPEASIDNDFEIILKRMIEDPYKDKTMIVITHNPSILKYLDSVYRIENKQGVLAKYDEAGDTV